VIENLKGVVCLIRDGQGWVTINMAVTLDAQKCYIGFYHEFCVYIVYCHFA
jgi:hypothetical protein